MPTCWCSTSRPGASTSPAASGIARWSRQPSRGAAVVTATHDIGEAATCDQVLLLNRRIVAQGPPQQVLNTARLLETFGITLQGIQHDDHHDFVIGEMPHGHEHGHEHDHDHRH